MSDTFIIKGIRNIKKLYFNQRKVFEVNNDGQISKLKNDEFVLDSEGANLKDIMNIDDIDYTRCTSNDIFEVKNVLGIEAAREVILREIRFILDVYGI